MQSYTHSPVPTNEKDSYHSTSPFELISPRFDTRCNANFSFSLSFISAQGVYGVSQNTLSSQDIGLESPRVLPAYAFTPEPPATFSALTTRLPSYFDSTTSHDPLFSESLTPLSTSPRSSCKSSEPKQASNIKTEEQSPTLSILSNTSAFFSASPNKRRTQKPKSNALSEKIPTTLSTFSAPISAPPCKPRGRKSKSNITTDTNTLVDEKEQRRLRNRISASNSRLRKKTKFQNLSLEVEQYKKTLQERDAYIQQLEAENRELKQKIEIESQTNNYLNYQPNQIRLSERPSVYNNHANSATKERNQTSNNESNSNFRPS